MHPSGIDERKYEFPENLLIIVGDHKGLPEKVESFVGKIGAEKVSLGKIEYLASHSIVILNYELDRRI